MSSTGGDLAGELLAVGCQGDCPVRGAAQERGAGDGFELADLAGQDGVPDAELAGRMVEARLPRGACLAHMRHPFAKPGQLSAVQAGKNRSGARAAVPIAGFAHAGAGSGQQMADTDPPQFTRRPGEQDAGRCQLGDLSRLPVVDQAGAGAQRRAHALIDPEPPARCHRQGSDESQ